MKKRKLHARRQDIPFYLNKTLPDEEMHQVEQCCDHDPAAQYEFQVWESIQKALDKRPMQDPPERVYQAVMGRLRRSETESWTSRRAVPLAQPLSYIVLSLVILALLWSVIRPGVVLEWSANVADLIVYRIYRAEAGNGGYILLEEVAPVGGTDQHTYVDVRLFPGRTYVYFVEGLRQGGEMVLSERITGNSMQVLPGQIALVIASFMAGYGVVRLFRIKNYLLYLAK